MYVTMYVSMYKSCPDCVHCIRPGCINKQIPYISGITEMINCIYDNFSLITYWGDVNMFQVTHYIILVFTECSQIDTTLVKLQMFYQ